VAFKHNPMKNTVLLSLFVFLSLSGKTQIIYFNNLEGLFGTTDLNCNYRFGTTSVRGFNTPAELAISPDGRMLGFTGYPPRWPSDTTNYSICSFDVKRNRIIDTLFLTSNSPFTF
jgi:hypothetical protein